MSDNMGRIIPKNIKRLGIEIYKSKRELISNDFAKNKELLEKISSYKSKKIRNVLAGYLKRLSQKKNIY